LTASPERDAIGRLGRGGRILDEWTKFAGGPGMFHRPVAVRASPQGDILVVQEDGQALLFRDTGDHWNPAFVSSFQADFANFVPPRRAEFDGPGRILIHDGFDNAPLVYDFWGKRMMALAPERDLTMKRFAEIVRVESTPDWLYVLDRSSRLWS